MFVSNGSHLFNSSCKTDGSILVVLLCLEQVIIFVSHKYSSMYSTWNIAILHDNKTVNESDKIADWKWNRWPERRHSLRIVSTAPQTVAYSDSSIHTFGNSLSGETGKSNLFENMATNYAQMKSKAKEATQHKHFYHLTRSRKQAPTLSGASRHPSRSWRKTLDSGQELELKKSQTKWQTLS